MEKSRKAKKKQDKPMKLPIDHVHFKGGKIEEKSYNLPRHKPS